MTSREITAAALLFSAIWAPVAYKALTAEAIAAEPPAGAVCAFFPATSQRKIEEWINEQNAAGRDDVVNFATNTLCAW